MKAKVAKKRVVLKPVTFEKAMAWLRRGRAIRRKGWHAASKIFRLGNEIFVRLPNHVPPYGSPSQWRPYPHDILSTDWEQAK